MLFPVRCWTCGKVIGHLWEQFQGMIKKRKICGDNLDSFEPLFQELGLKRMCCHTMFLTHYQQYKDAIKMGFPEDFSTK